MASTSEYQGLGPIGARADTIDRPTACLHLNEVIAQVFQLLLNSYLSRLTDGDHTDHGGDANGDSKHRKGTAELIPKQGFHGR
jgi:hypothetical protein